MRYINGFLAGAAVSVVLIVAGKAVAQTVTSAPAPTVHKYTQPYRAYMRGFNCTEDEYLFVPSNHVNTNVNYHTPRHPLCVAIELTRKAPR